MRGPKTTPTTSTAFPKCFLDIWMKNILITLLKCLVGLEEIHLKFGNILKTFHNVLVMLGKHFNKCFVNHLSHKNGMNMFSVCWVDNIYRTF